MVKTLKKGQHGPRKHILVSILNLNYFHSQLDFYFSSISGLFRCKTLYIYNIYLYILKILHKVGIMFLPREEHVEKNLTPPPPERLADIAISCNIYYMYKY